MSFIFFWKEMSWILIFHFFFNVTKWYSEKKATVSGITEFRPLSRYWEQTLTIFDDVLLEKTVHARLGHHARKSQKA